MGQRFEIEKRLNRPQMDELEAFAREPGKTVDGVHEWGRGRGFWATKAGAENYLSRDAVYNWKKDFDASDKYRLAAEATNAFMDAVGKLPTSKIGEAVNRKLGQRLWEMLLRFDADPESMSPKDAREVSVTIKNLFGAEEMAEAMRQKQAAAVKAGEAMAKTGASGEAVVNRVREILGIAA